MLEMVAAGHGFHPCLSSFLRKPFVKFCGGAGGVCCWVVFFFCLFFGTNGYFFPENNRENVCVCLCVCVCVFLEEHLYIPLYCLLSLQGKVVTF